MAKLEGVKVVDMIDGEIMKISYKGEEYGKVVEGVENKDDIALVVNEWGSQRKGEYYRVIKEEHFLYRGDSHNFVHIKGKKGEASCSREDVRLFRKVESPRIPKPGDKIRIIAPELTGGMYGKGDILTINQYNGTSVFVEEFNSPQIFVREFEIIEEGGETSETDTRLIDLESRADKVEKRVSALEKGENAVELFDKPAQVGDIIRINENTYATMGEYREGDELTVRRVRERDGVVKVEENERFIHPSEFDIIGRDAKENPKLKTVKRHAKVGERILITDAIFTHGEYDNGDILEVSSIRSHPDRSLRGVFAKGVESVYIHHDEYEVIVEEGEEEQKEELKDPRDQFAKGDKVRLISGGEEWPLVGFVDGEVYEVKNVKYDDHPASPVVRIECGGKGGFAKAHQLEKVELTDEDLTFLKIGRELGEFKKGDIAEVVTSPAASREGSLVEIMEELRWGVTARGSEGIEFSYNSGDLKLIAPTDARVDRDAD